LVDARQSVLDHGALEAPGNNLDEGHRNESDEISLQALAAVLNRRQRFSQAKDGSTTQQTPLR
jgi:hypothetical protein